MALAEMSSSKAVSDWMMASLATTLPARMKSDFQQAELARRDVERRGPEEKAREFRSSDRPPKLTVAECRPAWRRSRTRTRASNSEMSKGLMR
jgi:hypothetical protein